MATTANPRAFAFLPTAEARRCNTAGVPTKALRWRVGTFAWTVADVLRTATRRDTACARAGKVTEQTAAIVRVGVERRLCLNPRRGERRALQGEGIREQPASLT